MWPLTAPMDDFATLNTGLLPLLLENQFDLYLNAHDSLTSFASRKMQDPFETLEQPEFESRIQNAEYWFKSSSQDRFKGFDQGQALHQVTVGNSGEPSSDDEIVTNRAQLGTFSYA